MRNGTHITQQNMFLPEACQDWEVVRRQEILQGRAGDRSNLRVDGKYVGERRQLLCVGIVCTEISSEERFSSMTRTKIHF